MPALDEVLLIPPAFPAPPLAYLTTEGYKVRTLLCDGRRSLVLNWVRYAMKRHNTPSTGATKVIAPPDLIRPCAGNWQKRDEKKPSDPNAETAAPKPTWCRYADSRLKHFHCR